MTVGFDEVTIFKDIASDVVNDLAGRSWKVLVMWDQSRRCCGEVRGLLRCTRAVGVTVLSWNPLPGLVPP